MVPRKGALYRPKYLVRNPLVLNNRSDTRRPRLRLEMIHPLQDLLSNKQALLFHLQLP